MVDSNNETIKKKKIVVKKKSKNYSSGKDTSFNEDEFDELNIKPKSRVRRKTNSPVAEEKAFVVDVFDKEESVEEDKIPIEAKRRNNVDLTTKLKNFRNNRKRRNVEIEKETPKTINEVIEEPEMEPEPKSVSPKPKPEHKKETLKSELKGKTKKDTKKEEKKPYRHS